MSLQEMTGVRRPRGAAVVHGHEELSGFGQAGSTRSTQPSKRMSGEFKELRIEIGEAPEQSHDQIGSRRIKGIGHPLDELYPRQLGRQNRAEWWMRFDNQFTG
jgi:hypothetical protein